MQVTKEINLVNFEFWAGAKDFAEKLTRKELEQIEFNFDDLFHEGMTETQINDIFWFDTEFICELIGETEDDILGRD